MKAVILAGGQGSRLRPITAQKPKPLCTLLGKPVIRHILTLLAQQQVEEAAVTLGYQGGRIREELEENSPIPLSFFQEDTPLGTAGGVKIAANGFAGDFLVVSGDAMCDFDLQAALRFHQKKGGAATLLVHRVDDPRDYGLVCADSEGRILSFAEKPSYLECVCDMANTGIYILSPSVLEQIPEGKPVDFAADLFPQLLEMGCPLYAYEPKGYWCDIGDIESYRSCQADMLAGKVRFTLEARGEGKNICAGPLPRGSYALRPPVYLGKGVVLGEGCIVGPNTVLEDGVQLGAGCRVEDSILQRDVTVGGRALLSGSVICEYAVLEEDTRAEPGSVLGACAMMERESVLTSSGRIWPGQRVQRGSVAAEEWREGEKAPLFFTEEGLSGDSHLGLPVGACFHIGAGTAGLSSHPVIGIGWAADSRAAEIYALACGTGAASAGATVWQFGECAESQFDFCLWQSQADYGIYADAAGKPHIRVCGRGGLPLCREEERRVENAVNRGEFRRVPCAEMGRISDLSNLVQMYPFELLKQGEGSLEGFMAEVKCPSPALGKILEDVLKRLGCRIESGGISVRLSADGRTASLTGEGMHLSGERMLAGVCLTQLEKGKEIALPHTAPHAIDEMAQSHGMAVRHYGECPSRETESDARKLAASQLFLRDGLMGTVRLFSYLARKQLRFAEFCRKIPAFTVDSRIIQIAVSPGVLLRRLAGKGSPAAEGMLLRQGTRTALLRPLKSGKGVQLFTECGQSETAAEIGDLFEQLVRGAGIDR